MSLPFFPLGSYVCLPTILLDHLHEQQHAAIVIVVTLLTAIMEEQVRPSITIAKVKNSIIIQVASLLSRPLNHHQTGYEG